MPLSNQSERGKPRSFSKIMKTKPKKDSRGGARAGAGRPKKEDTVIMRIPVSKVDEVKKIISK